MRKNKVITQRPDVKPIALKPQNIKMSFLEKLRDLLDEASEDIAKDLEDAIVGRLISKMYSIAKNATDKAETAANIAAANASKADSAARNAELALEKMKDIIENMENLDPKTIKMIDENFWNLLG